MSLKIDLRSLTTLEILLDEYPIADLNNKKGNRCFRALLQRQKLLKNKYCKAANDEEITKSN